MNRYKKEVKSNHEKAQEGLTPEQIKDLDIQETENKAVRELARKIHAEKFPEEYDFMYDGNWDASDRKKGINPMSDEYVAKVDEKRRNLKVSTLSESGMPTANDAMEMCLQEAKHTIKELRTRIDEILFYKWDPLHLSDTNWIRYEYESYVPEVFRLALEGKSYHPIAEHLTKIATEVMSMTANREHDIEIAKLIFSLCTNKPYHPNRTVIEVE